MRSRVRSLAGWIVVATLACAIFPSAPRAQSGTVDGRWLVSLSTPGADLDALRDAIVTRPDPNRAQRLIADFERELPIARARFATACARAGGRIERHWWLVNACLVTGPSGLGEALENMPDVVRVEPDRLVPAAENRPLDAFNHGDALVHSLGIDGAAPDDPILAVLDSGIDVDVGGLGRPHRAFFRDGDPSILEPGGIGGSRIVRSVQLGALPADDVHGHGTSVAAIAAGASWGTSASVDGHAPGACIANYAVGDSIGAGQSIFALFSSITSGFQQLVIDRSTLPIRVANLSFEGDQDPTTVQQVALDAAVFVADVLVVVAAGNGGPAASTGGQSCANGIAVAAVRVDEHIVEDYSARGPVLGDPTRTYPDLAAIGTAVVPVLDCEAPGGSDLFFRTSSAAPRVAGAAMLLRASFPSLRADETKAILLAASVDLSARNPGDDRNSRGVGLLRTDRALATAGDPTRHGRDVIQGTATPRSLGLSVDPGMPTAIAIAWSRDPVDAAWSDLDIAVRDGGTGSVLATAQSPRNLYELARFTAPPSGVVFVDVTAASLQNGQPQEFAIAVATLSAMGASVDPRGTFEPAEDGCAGPEPNGDPICASSNDPADPAALATTVPFAERYENAILVVAPTATTVTGFELFAQGDVPARLDTALFLDGGGLPTHVPDRTSHIDIETTATWYRTTFDVPLTVPAGSSFYLGIQGWNQTRAILEGGSDVLTVASRDACDSLAGGAWNGTFSAPIGIRVLCSGPPRAELLRNRTSGAIRLAGQCTFTLDRAPAGALATLLLGFSDSHSPTLGPLPLDLGFLGSTGCAIHVDPVVAITTTTDALGASSVPADILPDPTLAGLEFFTQFAVFDPTGPRPLTTSNSAAHRVGTL